MELLPLEKPHFYEFGNGVKKFSVVWFLTLGKRLNNYEKQIINQILADHIEANDVTGIKRFSCRICLNGQLRTVEASKENFQIMLNLYQKQGYNQQANNFSASVEQHCVFVIFTVKNSI